MFPGGSPELVEPTYKNPKLSAPFNEQLTSIICDYVRYRLSSLGQGQKVRQPPPRGSCDVVAMRSDQYIATLSVSMPNQSPMVDEVSCAYCCCTCLCQDEVAQPIQEWQQ